MAIEDACASSCMEACCLTYKVCDGRVATTWGGCSAQPLAFRMGMVRTLSEVVLERFALVSLYVTFTTVCWSNQLVGRERVSSLAE